MLRQQSHISRSIAIFVELFEKAKERGLALVEALVPLAEKNITLYQRRL